MAYPEEHVRLLNVEKKLLKNYAILFLSANLKYRRFYY